MKKIIALVLAMLMMFSLAACGGDTTPDTTDPATGSDPTTETSAALQEPKQ